MRICISRLSMRYQIIPGINTDNFEEIKQKIKLLEPFSDWFHLDAADGTFTKNTIWHNPEDLIGFTTSLNIEAHLMVAQPEKIIEKWFLPSVKRIVFNLESGKAPDFIIERCRLNNTEVGISIGPDTAWTRVISFLDKINVVQVLCVYPGLAGQKFIADCLDKIRHLRKECPECDIEVDGGINPETAKKAKEAGANIFVSVSYILGGDIKDRIDKLQRAIR